MAPTIQINKYYWLNDEPVIVQDIRTNGWVLVVGSDWQPRPVSCRELRQCKCPQAGEHHGHGGRRERMYRCTHP